MAIYCCTTSPVSRRAGRSATAAAAYRAGEKIKDAKSGETHDYSKRRGVASADMVYPSGTPENARPSRAALWNMAEASEKRKDSRVAREYMVALPAELDEDERRRLALEFAQALADRHGCAADCCIHLPGKNGDQRNHHAHILCTSRRIGADGALGEKCDIELGDKDRRKRGLTKAADEVKAVRAIWEDMCNRALDRAGSKERVSAAKREDGLATMHLGPIACGMERRGEATSQGSVNRAVIAAREAAAKAAAAKKAVAEALAAQEPEPLEEKSEMEKRRDAILAHPRCAGNAGARRTLTGADWERWVPVLEKELGIGQEQPKPQERTPEPEKSEMEKRRDALLANPLCNANARSLLTEQGWEDYVESLEETMAEMRPRSAAAEEAAIEAVIDETTSRPDAILPGKPKPKPKTRDGGRGGWTR